MSKGLIVLDPGHGQFGNPHTTREGFYEGTQNFVLACFLKDQLTRRGFEVKLTRNKLEDNPTLKERGRLAGESGALLFLSLHSNAPGKAATPERYVKIRGAEVYYSITDEAVNIPFARALNNAIVTTMNTADRGIHTRRLPDNPERDYYGVIRSSAESGCRQAFLAEHGFHTNPEDSAFLQNSSSLLILAAAEAEVIDRFFG